jgi:hypothetical protein
MIVLKYNQLKNIYIQTKHNMKNLNEELNRMLYLTQHKRGQVISEQSVGLEIPDANKKPRGVTSLQTLEYGSSFLAKNVKFENKLYYLGFHKEIGKNLPKLTPGTLEKIIPGKPQIIIPDLNFAGSDLPYPNNFINPQFDLYPDSETKIDKYVSTISEFIKEDGGLESNNTIKIFESNKDKNGKTIFIKGTADYFKPNFNVPNEMKNKGANKIDHDYGGKKDPAEMNLYLAEQRAIKFGNILAEKLSKKTGIPKDIFLNYMDFSGYSYYGTGNQGVKSIDVKIKYQTTTKTDNTPNKTTPGTEGKVVPPIEKEVEVDLSPYGGEIIKGLTVTNKDGYQFIGIPFNIANDLLDKKIIHDYDPNNSFDGISKPKFKIKNSGEISLGEVNFGKLVPASEVTNNSDFMYLSNPGIYTFTGEVINGTDGESYVTITNLYLGLSRG